MSSSTSRRPAGAAGGFTLIELLLALSLGVVMTAIAVPMVSESLDELRTGMAARYIEARIMDARMHAVRRAAPVALRFEAEDDDYRVAEYVDGNGNGVRTADIGSGADPALGPGQRLRERFSGVAFGLRPGVPDADGVRSVAEDGVRIGVSRILTLGTDGTATSGTLYLRGHRAQYAVRILGATGRTRVMRFQRGTERWMSR